MGLQALSDAVFEPAGVAFEVLYLDRSEGDEANTHQGGKGDGEEVVRLLYRPLVSTILPSSFHLRFRPLLPSQSACSSRRSK